MPDETEHARIIWPGAHNAVRAVVRRHGHRSYTVEMSSSIPWQVCCWDISIRPAWNRALRYMLDPNAEMEDEQYGLCQVSR